MEIQESYNNTETNIEERIQNCEISLFMFSGNRLKKSVRKGEIMQCLPIAINAPR
jgi:hypothetical protein